MYKREGETAMSGMMISVGTNKGGAGKSALALFAAMTAANQGKRVLVMDGDSQCGLSWRIPGALKHLRRHFVRDLASGKTPVKIEIPLGGGLYFLPGDLEGEKSGEGEVSGEGINSFLRDIFERYDVFIFDSGPRPTKLEREILSRGDVHLLPAGSDRASIVGVVYRMCDVLNMLEKINREQFFFIPWGVNTGEKTGKNSLLIKNMSSIMADFGMSVLPPFPPVQDMTDFICSLESADMDSFLKYPGIARKKKEILGWSELLWESLLPFVAARG